jgi:trans-L-3-hydroxyproline dehydratase
MKMSNSWQPPPDWLKITTIDAHTAGEPFRVITGGFPKVPGKTILQKRRYARQHLDHLRTALMWEPRGHADMYGAIPTEPISEEADLGVLFMHNEGYSTMCGHGIIGLVKVGLDVGVIELPESFGANEPAEIRIDTPAGLVTAIAQRENGSVVEVAFLNVPSFALALDQAIDVPGIGEVCYDLGFGGAFYAFVQAEELGVRLTPEDFRELIRLGTRIKQSVSDTGLIQHPFEEDLSFLYGTIFIGPPEETQHHSRNVCVFADGEVDRCPTGTGVSARAAIHLARGELEIGEPFVVESILGSTFTGQIEETTEFGPHQAIIPKVSGSAHIVGSHTFLIDPADPLRDGFLLR